MSAVWVQLLFIMYAVWVSSCFFFFSLLYFFFFIFSYIRRILYYNVKILWNM